ncbi:hypothetical protein DCAR_0934281 [Daucus carota subsp. sativus]|uniref:Uncharacterized protein n=1 Tax=Daucus carota subsp. sativus TaxID=79200 RepID=A0A175YG37_DAUCS|nr:hypothetical protein DCAR_0934281 [Daucus carota subsp. sativus]
MVKPSKEDQVRRKEDCEVKWLQFNTQLPWIRITNLNMTEIRGAKPTRGATGAAANRKRRVKIPPVRGSIKRRIFAIVYRRCKKMSVYTASYFFTKLV